MKRPRGRPRKETTLSGAERARRYRARQALNDFKQLAELIQLMKSSNDTTNN